MYYYVLIGIQRDGTTGWARYPSPILPQCYKVDAYRAKVDRHLAYELVFGDSAWERGSDMAELEQSPASHLFIVYASPGKTSTNQMTRYTAVVYVDARQRLQYYIKPTDRLTEEDKKTIELVTTNETHANQFYNLPPVGWQWAATIDKSTIDCVYMAVSSDP